jgi:carboxymethylenebutenolidase
LLTGATSRQPDKVLLTTRGVEIRAPQSAQCGDPVSGCAAGRATLGLDPRIDRLSKQSADACRGGTGHFAPAQMVTGFDLMDAEYQPPRLVAASAALLLLGASAMISSPLLAQSVSDAMATRVEFPSTDGAIKLVGYVFAPEGPSVAPVPGVVMMHGRQGAYSTLANGVYAASTLSKRHQFWGRFWAAHGYLAVLVDGFGPRGYPQGFGRHTYGERPPELDEVTIRPRDAYAALAYLRTRGDAIADRIGLQGWSNGGSATLAAMAPDAPGTTRHDPVGGFRAALAFYPGCGLKDHFAATGYAAYAPLRVFMGTADEEVSPQVCRRLLERAGGDVRVRFYDGATHDFDDPGARRQRVEANAKAREDAVGRAAAFFAHELGGSPPASRSVSDP